SHSSVALVCCGCHAPAALSCLCLFFVLASPPASFFFFPSTPTTSLYTLSLHDALPIFGSPFDFRLLCELLCALGLRGFGLSRRRDRKSTRLNSSHVSISYAVFCLKKKKKQRAGKAEEAKGKDSGVTHEHISIEGMIYHR